ncbi:MAG: hypothetical protein EOP51_11915 [Sphingobacteriales bacterium]|nr:MAG: hypothetical protein EOP51_11915 [Sphingobacteriales bacterium]
MKKPTRYLVFALLLAATATAWAQDKKTAEKTKTAKPKVVPVPVYLGNSNINGGKLTKQTFDSLLGQGLKGKDSSGNIYKVNGFAFTYAERNLYEDSVGNPIVVTDNLAEYCFGDTVSTFILGNIHDRSKNGDTVYFDNISLTSPNGSGAWGKSIRLILAK